MYYGMGRGRGMGKGGGGGMGFAFRGASPPWPYVGRGRGGLPRCGYYLSGPGQFAAPTIPFTPPTGEAELDYLKSQAEALKPACASLRMRNKE
jgi:hypothetical protein